MKFIFLFFALFVSVSLWSQELAFIFKGAVENSDLGKSEGGVTVSIVQGSSTIVSTSTASNGKYSLTGKVNYASPFQVVFSKSGLVSKRIDFNLAKMNEEDIPPGDAFRPIETLDMTLFKVRENVDFSFLETEPVGEFDWNTQGMSIRLDQVEKNRVQTKIADLLAKADKDKTEAEAKYLAAITAADAFYNQKKYEDALTKYEEALNYKPQEKYPADRIIELDALIQAQKKLELADKQANEEYYSLISAADALRDQDKLEPAIAKYNEAIAKRSEQYPKDQVAALTKLVAERKKEAENQAAYDAVIKTADAFLKQNSLLAAKDKYTEATKLKPSEKYPKDKLKEIETKLAGQSEADAKKKKYDEALVEADNLFTAEDFEGAKKKYEEVLTYESAATYPKERIKLCVEKINEAKAEKEKLEKIKILLSAGDEAMVKKTWTLAKGKFNEVISIDPGNAEATEKLAIVEQKIIEEADLAAQDVKFNGLIKEGDLAATAKKYADALAKYEEALTIKTTPVLTTKIADVKAKIAEEASLAEKGAKYTELMSEAETLLTEGKLEEAKGKYQEASTIDPKQTLPKTKIAEINALILKQTAEQQKKAGYDAAIASADELFNNSKYAEAKLKYNEALTFDNTQIHPKDRIIEIDKLIKSDELANQKKAGYESAITAADKLFTASKLEEAKAKYNLALTFDDTQSYPNDKIVEIDKLIAEKMSKEAKKAEVNKLLAAGLLLHNQKKLPEAKAKYEEVLALDPANVEATNKLNIINAALSALQSEAEKEETFNALKKEGFDLAAQNELESAKLKLKEALALKTDIAVKNKLAEIEAALTAQKSQIELDEKYNALISTAEGKEGSKDYRGAIEKYKEASVLKPNESLPKSKIAELEGLVAASAEQIEIDKRYNAFMKKGNELMMQKNYLDAIKEFNNALAEKPTEQEPVNKAAEAEKLEREKDQEIDVQYEKILTVAQSKIDEEDFVKAEELLERAKKIKPTDDRPPKMLNSIIELKKRNAEYDDLMKKADALAVAKKYEEAKSGYQLALNKKPTESKPSERIAEMDRLISDSSSAAQKEALYIDYMSKGNVAQNNKFYEQALGHFQNAISVKPGDVTAQNKINEIQQILDDIANADKKEIELLNKFNEFIKQADDLFAAESYLPAKSIYETALKLDPSSTYAKTQIDECVRLEKLRGIMETDREYNKIIEAADKAFVAASYDKARDYYSRALSFKEDDPYPKKKLAEIDAILNPATVESAKLEDLGDPFDNSIMDGMSLLQKAEEERKLLKNTQITATHNDIKDAEVDMIAEKTEDHRNNSNEIFQVQQMIIADEGESDLNRQGTIKALTEAEFERENALTDNVRYEYSGNLSDQNILYIVKEQTAMDYGERESVYSENTDILKTYNTAQDIVITERGQANYGKNISADQTLTTVKNKFDDGVRDDANERAEIAQDVVQIQNRIDIADQELSDTRYEILLSNKKEVNNVVIDASNKNLLELQAAKDNNEELIGIKKDVVDAEVLRDEVETGSAYKTDREMAVVKQMVISDQEGLDANRLASNEVLKKSATELADANVEAYNGELDKYIQNKIKINEEVKVNSEIDDLALLAQSKKIEYVEAMDEKANIETQSGLKGDELERLNADRSIQEIYVAKDVNTEEESGKREESNELLKDINKTIQSQETAKGIGENDKHYDSQAKINNVDGTPKSTSKMANSLGKEYPEGVSEESFTKSDQNGLMTTIITRRIVVIDGHADVYVRTQTMNGITYSKNGNPSLTNVWQKETQGPHLERHY